MFPKQADNTFRGHRIASITFLLITLFTFVRSCIHIFAPDGGAGSIAGIINPSGDVISLFALWGLSQLLMAFIYLIAYLRYKSLISFMYILVLLEYSGRTIIGQLRPLYVSHIPPGAIGEFILAPLAAIMLILSLQRPRGKTHPRTNTQ